MKNYLNKYKTIDEIPDDELFCDSCGMTYMEFLETGEFRCENCYKVFKSRTIKKMKNKIENELKRNTPPKNIHHVSFAKSEVKEKIDELKKLLELCKSLGETEKAQVIEREIRQLENEEIEK